MQHSLAENLSLKWQILGLVIVSLIPLNWIQGAYVFANSKELWTIPNSGNASAIKAPSCTYIKSECDVQLQLYPASFFGFMLHSHHSSSEQNRSSLAGPYPFDIFIKCLRIKLNADKNNDLEHKWSQSQQTVPSLRIFHVHCVAWLWEWGSEVNAAPQELLVHAMSNPSGLVPWKKEPALLSSPFSQKEKAWGPSSWFQLHTAAGDPSVGQ